MVKEGREGHKATKGHPSEHHEPDHVIHERKLNYYKKTVSLLSIALEVFFLFFVGAIIFLFVASNDASVYEQENSILQSRINVLESQVSSLQSELDQTMATLEKKPDTTFSSTIKDGNYTSLFTLSDTTQRNITVRVDDILHQIQMGYKRRNVIQEVSIPLHTRYAQSCYDFALFCSNSPSDIASLKSYYDNELSLLRASGPNYLVLPLGATNKTVMDFRSYVIPIGFEDELTQLYNQRKDDRSFVYEVWSIVSQLTSYSQEIEETPRYPLETLFVGGVDCEDSAILFASMLKAANTSWDISFLYTDINNPTQPFNFNHVLVHVDTGIEEFFIETTGKDVPEPYEEVTGSYVKIS